jgi:hypothetical protein
MVTILIGKGLLGLFPPALLILAGAAVVAWGLLHRRTAAPRALE